jgi:hypothetical protein
MIKKAARAETYKHYTKQGRNCTSYPGREIHQQIGGLLKAEQRPLVGPHLVFWYRECHDDPGVENDGHNLLQKKWMLSLFYFGSGQLGNYTQVLHFANQIIETQIPR